MISEIKITKGKIAIIDADDYERVSALKWFNHPGKTKDYAARGLWINGKNKCQYMHNFIFGDAPKGFRIDHINGNGLDNRKCNLRYCTKAQNSVNSPKIKGILGKPTSSKYKGVCWDKGLKKWYASIRINTKKTGLGYYVIEANAAQAYNFAAYEHHGEFATLNKAQL